MAVEVSVYCLATLVDRVCVCFILQSVDGKRDLLFKVLVIGDLAAGKTSLVKSYVHQFFSPHYRATISYIKDLACLYVALYFLELLAHNVCVTKACV